jgi:GWxTD domain-containing protein
MAARKMIAAAIVLVMSVGGAYAAVSQKYADWGKGPVQFLMTDEEEKAWKAIQTDVEAEKFIEVFWVRRDPTPDTPQNEFKAEYESLVKAADQYFKEGKTAGSLTDRGMALLLFGQPSSRKRTGGATRGSTPRSAFEDTDTRGSAVPATEQWHYEGAAAERLGVSDFEILFTDSVNQGIMRMTRSRVEALIAKAVALRVVSPELSAVPDYTQIAAQRRAEAEAAAKAAAEQASREWKDASLKSAYEAYKTTPSGYGKAFIAVDDGITSEGEQFVPVMLYMPRPAGLSASTRATFFGAVEDAKGNVVRVLEEAMSPVESRGDFFVDSSLALLPGDYVARLGLMADGKVVAMATREVKVPAIDATAAGVSRMLVSNNIYPLAAAQAPTDPFAYGGIKVVPKADDVFSTADELWYFFTLRNPGTDDAGNPKAQVRLTIEGTSTDGKPVKKEAPLMQADLQPLAGVPGQYGIGNAIPLDSFVPGDYVLKVRLIDSVNQQTYNMEENFKVVAR